MRSIIINSKERIVSEVDIDGKLETLQEKVGGLIDPVYLGFEGTDRHCCYVNDEGLLNNPQHFFMFKDGHQPLAGNGVILSDDGEGGDAPATLPLEWVKDRVAFMDLQQVREWAAHEDHAISFFVGEPEAAAEAKHTPAPWETLEIIDGISIKDSRNVTIAYCDDATDADEIEITEAETTANARLIAAAPDMRAALEFVGMTFADIEASKRKGYYTECPKIVAAALAKAESGNSAEKESTEKEDDLKHAKEQGQAQYDSIEEMVAGLGDDEKSEEARDAIMQDPLSVLVREGWHEPGKDAGAPQEFEILLSTGGPAVRLIGTLDDHGEPDSVRLQ